MGIGEAWHAADRCHIGGFCWQAVQHAGGGEIGQLTPLHRGADRPLQLSQHILRNPCLSRRQRPVEIAGGRPDWLVLLVLGVAVEALIGIGHFIMRAASLPVVVDPLHIKLRPSQSQFGIGLLGIPEVRRAEPAFLAAHLNPRFEQAFAERCVAEIVAVGKCLGHDGTHGELQQSSAGIFHLRAGGQLDETPLVGVIAKQRRVEFIPHHPRRRHLCRQRAREEAECRELPRHRAVEPDRSRQVAAEWSGRGKRDHRQWRDIGGMGCDVGFVLIPAGEQVAEIEFAEIEIAECGGAVVLQAQGGPILFGGDAIPEDIGKLPADRRLQESGEFPLRVAAPLGDPIVVH